MGLVALRKGPGFLPVLLADLMLEAGDIGERVEGCGARKGLLAASGLIRGRAGLAGFDIGPSPPIVGALTLVMGNVDCVV
jgi:hypothetical protein